MIRQIPSPWLELVERDERTDQLMSEAGAIAEEGTQRSSTGSAAFQVGWPVFAGQRFIMRSPSQRQRRRRRTVSSGCCGLDATFLRSCEEGGGSESDDQGR